MEREAYENFVTTYTKSAGYYPKSVVPLLGLKKPQCDNTTA
ncbi:hypothetical protein ECSTEC94C_3354 [Escherichia coli STEC_94C]|nr:hypothetical protein ECSTEC94C_3354 [Escherichia coli STEC_94C]